MKEQARRRCTKARDDRYFFHPPDHGVFGPGAAAPQKLGKNHEASPGGRPLRNTACANFAKKNGCRTYLKNEKNAQNDLK